MFLDPSFFLFATICHDFLFRLSHVITEEQTNDSSERQTLKCILALILIFESYVQNHT